MHSCAFYQCHECEKPYFGGMIDCMAELGMEEQASKEDLICQTCQLKAHGAGETTCEKHGNADIDWKCMFCCSVAVWHCFGTHYFCDRCHTEYCNRGCRVELRDCGGKDCPLGIPHPPAHSDPAKSSFPLGCGLCRSEKLEKAKKMGNLIQEVTLKPMEGIRASYHVLNAVNRRPQPNPEEERRRREARERRMQEYHEYRRRERERMERERAERAERLRIERERQARLLAEQKAARKEGKLGELVLKRYQDALNKKDELLKEKNEAKIVRIEKLALDKVNQAAQLHSARLQKELEVDQRKRAIVMKRIEARNALEEKKAEVVSKYNEKVSKHDKKAKVEKLQEKMDEMRKSFKRNNKVEEKKEDPKKAALRALAEKQKELREKMKKRPQTDRKIEPKFMDFLDFQF